jgi:hypothetical protein
MPTPRELRDEAVATERLARMVSFGPDRQWLTDKAEALRHQAERQEQTAHRPRQEDGPGSP